MSQLTEPRRTGLFGASPMRLRESIEGLVYLSPWLLGYILFGGGPILASLYLSFTKYNVLRPPEFIGFQNYVYALTKDELFIPAILKTFYYAIMVVPPAI